MVSKESLLVCGNLTSGEKVIVSKIKQLAFFFSVIHSFPQRLYQTTYFSSIKRSGPVTIKVMLHETVRNDNF